ncbi:MAG: PBP1A family penicillin-binding protein [Bacteroidota bacterium]|nr:PBP1A family penicillin-binding protein [Bacteroidota bacterium]MDP4232171.1 PBP1A family penicillin-binding protein [Bacteroidota bacterium]MDP4241121.1 PBP1A family penicillin-binding protein [Bacteroidota bacterium]MDP4286513.1 PBP1A family penicillin-binding protein [Bacteroidota bacterium]
MTTRRRNIYIASAAGVVLLVLLWWDVQRGLPSLAQLESPHPEIATRIISTDGEPIDQYFVKNRTNIHLRNVPPFLIKALISTEDRNFFHHWGIDLWGNVRAIGTDIFSLHAKQGASTITQQLARNLYLTQEKSILRKLREAITAVQIERNHTKNEILEMYLNVTYFGRGTYGIEAASQAYFGRDVNRLTPAQCAYLVGILKGPENYDPEDDYDNAIARRNTVLENMVNAGYLRRADAERLKKESLKTKPYVGYQGIAPHFAEMVRQQLQKMPQLAGYDIYRDGLIVYTTLNAAMQRAANRAVLEHIADYQKNVVDRGWNWAKHKAVLDSVLAKAIRNNADYHAASSDADRNKIAAALRANKDFVDSVKDEELVLQAGLVAIDQSTGEIVAMVGASNYKEVRYGLNHATQILRQPGSAFKPILYASAFEHGSTPESSVSNEPITIRSGGQNWSPHNFAGEYEGGTVSIRHAIEQSLNLSAVHTILELTSAKDVVSMAKRLGIRSNVPPYPSIALGTAEVSPLDLTAAYAVFANEGVRAEPYDIIRVEDKNGKVLYEHKPEFENVLDPKICRELTSALQGVILRGTATRVLNYFRYPAAGKTGTTQNYADAWFMGYTPQYTAGVWVGFDDKRITFNSSNGQGGRAAAPIWGKFMKYAYDAVRPKIEYFNTGYPGAPQAAPDTTKRDSLGQVQITKIDSMRKPVEY